MCGCESWTIKKAEYQRIDAFELQGWRKQRNIISNSMKELRFDPQQVKYIDRKIDEIQIKYVI